MEIDQAQEHRELDESGKKHELDEVDSKVHELPVQIELIELESPTELPGHLKEKQKESEAYGGYERWVKRRK